MAESDPERMDAAEEARAIVDKLAGLYAENGINLFIPSLLWQKD